MSMQLTRRAVIQQSDPSLVLANSSSDASFLNALETLVRESPRLSEYAEDNESAMRQSSEGVQIEYRMQRDFNATNGRRLMSLLNVAEITSNAANDAAPQLRAGAYLLDHTSNPLTVRVVQRHPSSRELTGDHSFHAWTRSSATCSVLRSLQVSLIQSSRSMSPHAAFSTCTSSSLPMNPCTDTAGSGKVLQINNDAML